MKTISYETKGTCCKEISFSIDKGCIFNIEFKGGCPGGLTAISKLLEGESSSKVISMLNGIVCGGKFTSCASQLAIAVEDAEGIKNE